MKETAAIVTWLRSLRIAVPSLPARTPALHSVAAPTTPAGRGEA